ncbi:MAG: FAD:protein FMN transferase, partial [Pseudomonadota bacterium]|nr:FAD:protein FMN transferase [Pseudomonadota bacterium]
MRRRAQPGLGTLVEITILDEVDSARIDAACAAAFQAVAQVHRLMSFHTPDSDVTRINRAKVGEAVAIDPATAVVLRAASALTEKSDGIFDVGCASRLVAWQLLPELHGSQLGERFD